MGIFGRTPKDTLIAAFDITSSSVGGVLFLHHPDKLPEILTTSRFLTDFFPDLEFKKFERSLHKTFERNVAHLKKFVPKGYKKPNLVVIVFSSPYYVSQSKVIRIRKPKPFEIAENFLKEAVTKEIESFKKNENQGADIIEHEFMQFKLNGYPVREPVGKHCHDFEASIYLSAGIKTVCEKISECVSYSFGETPVRFQTFPFVAFSGLKDVVDISKGLLIVDIGGEITELVLIRNNILEEAISFPLGENFLVRRIASAFHFSPEESAALLSQYAREELHSETREKVGKIIEDAGGKWCEFFKKAGDESLASGFAFQNRLLIGGKAALALKNSILCAENQPLLMQFLLPEAFKNHFIFRKGFNEDKDILLMFSVLFVDKLFLDVKLCRSF